jgi:hypothetical protein
LGNGTTTASSVPIQVSNLSGVVAIAGGWEHSLALKSDGTVWAWGYNGDGELGNGTTANSSTPVQVSSLSGAVAIAGGAYHSLALKSDGTAWAWGDASYGQLGNGASGSRSSTNSSTPVQVSSLSGLVAIAGGYRHSLALKSDGTVWAWGYNIEGQLGNGTVTTTGCACIPSAVQVSNLSGVVAIAGGLYHSMALKSDGTVWAWGHNASGQLGNGTTTDSSTPVQVSSLSGALAIASGGSHSLALAPTPTFTLTVSTTGTGSGTITSAPAGISCPGTCTFSFTQGTVVTLTPAAPAGSAFAGWGGACTGTGACSVTMNSAQSVSATFNLTTVTVTGAGTGNGTVTGTGGISCAITAGVTSGTCTNTSPISAGDTVTLTATPASSLYVFAGWSGACSGSGACTFTMGASAVTATATFSPAPQFALTVSTVGAGSGTVTSNPAGISCPGTCAFSFTQGTVVTLTPAAPAGSAFAGWGGACTGTGACSVTMNSAQSVSATFNLTTVTVTGAGTGNGTVTGTGGISCTSTFGATSGTCTNTSPISAGDTVTLTATPASSLYVFAGWSGACSGTGACTFTMGTSAVTATATFSFNSGATPTLVADYQFANVYTSSVGEDPALVDIGSGTNAFATDTVRGASQTVLVFPTGNGLQLSPTSGLFANVAYTVAALVRLDTISGYGRILDFKNAASDDGLYNLNGNLVFYPVAGGSAGPMTAGAYVHVVLTRAADGTVSGYVNGVQQFSLADSSNLAVIDSSNVLRFFKDDNAVPNENSSGAVARIRIWNGALTAAQVAALEPAPTADLSVSVVPAGGSAATVTITNLGPANATNVVLADTLDRFGFVSATPSQGGPCTFAASVVTCPLGSLAAGASATVTVVVTAPSQGWAAQILHAASDVFDPNPTNNAARIGPSLSSFNTPAGANVVVSATDASGDTATVTFASVTRVGATTISASAATSAAPAGFRFGTPAVIYDISSNADFTGPITVALRFNPANFHHPALVRVFHFEGGTWVDRTMGLNVALGSIAGQVMSLSPFALLEPVDTIPVANAGADHSVPGAMAAGARVTLDGSASSDADGDPLTYRWSGPFSEGGGTVTGVNPTVTLPLGVSKVSLVVNDGEADSPAVALNLAVADFQVSAPAGSVALTRGQSTSFTITMTPQYGAFGAPINLSCAPGAADVTCSFPSASVTPGATASTATLTVTAAATVARAPGRSMPAYFALWLGTLPVFGVVFLAAGRRKKWQMAVLLMLLLVLVASHIGCGGGATTQTQSSSPPSTPGSKAVTITVTGTSGTLQHSSSVTVTIPQ